MKNNHFNIEQGPIRPPNEARSLLLRVTRNCPWNQCLFCPVYKNQKFSIRNVQEIKQDIVAARDIADDIKAISIERGFGGEVNDQVIRDIFSRSSLDHFYRSMAAWMYYGSGACFLQDADNLIMKTKDLVEVLQYLRKKFPEITRVTTYSRSRTVVRKSVESLTQIRKAGLDRVHIGLETGFDPLLKLVKKGVSSQQQVEAGKKCLEAGLELSEYVMPGLGGQEMWEDHARATAETLNKINPHFIRLRSLRIPERVPLHDKLQDGSFTMQTDDMLAEEMKLFLQTLDQITSTITSDHIMNLLEEISGKYPQDKAKMLTVIEKYQALSDMDRLIYRAGRRGGTYHSTDDLKSDPSTYQKIKSLLAEIQANDGDEGVDKFITELADRYI